MTFFLSVEIPFDVRVLFSPFKCSMVKWCTSEDVKVKRVNSQFQHCHGVVTDVSALCGQKKETPASQPASQDVSPLFSDKYFKLSNNVCSIGGVVSEQQTIHPSMRFEPEKLAICTFLFAFFIGI